MPNITIKVNGELQNFQEAEILKLMEVGTGEPVSFTFGSVTSGGNTYEIPFYLEPNTEQANEINNVISAILADDSSYNIVVTDAGGAYRMPAIAMLNSRATTRIISFLIWPDGSVTENAKYEIKRLSDGAITTAKSILSLGGGGSAENGATFIPSVSNEGVISWTNDKGLSNPVPVNIKGNTPQKGTDYFTESDIAEIVDAVYAKIADGNGVSY